MEQSASTDTLLQFLSVPLNDGAQILARFAQLPNAVSFQGKHPLARCVYVPGTRKDRVLLVAHVDTVWDQHYKHPQAEAKLVLENDCITSGLATAGIGADDRAGCAALWLMRDSVHSLLLVDGEERGHFGAKYILRKNRRLLHTLNRHSYLVQLDLPGAAEYSFKGVANTKRFQRMSKRRASVQAPARAAPISPIFAAAAAASISQLAFPTTTRQAKRCPCRIGTSI